MPDRLRNVTILGVHPVLPSEQLFGETLALQWGADLSGEALSEARRRVREHFDGLYLIELRLDPPNADVDWSQFTQSRIDQSEAYWQVPYDERRVDEPTGRWVFFMHFVDLSQPLQTPAGPRTFPRPSPCPSHLAHVRYEAP